jgi:putative PEP-CTERM system TPR-repeat lipoprotein
MAIQADDPAAAEYHAAMARKAAPESLQGHYIHALLEFRRKNLRSAKAAVDQVLRSRPTDVPALLLAGAIEYAEKRYAQAQQLLLRGLTRLPTHLGGRKLYAATLLKIDQPAPALDVLLPTVQIAAEDGELQAMIGQAYMQAGDYAAAAKYLDEASRLRPHDVPTRLALGWSHMAAGEWNQALRALDSGLRFDAASSELDALRVAVHLQRGDIARAEQAWATLEQNQPGSAHTLQLQAAILTAKKDISGARRALEQALVANRTFVPAAVALAKLDLGDNDPRSARRRLEQILRLEPHNAEALLALAEVGPAIHATTAEIEGWLTEAHRLNPNSSRVSVLLAQLRLESGDPREAVRIAQKAANAHPKHVGILEVLGSAQDAIGDAAGAVVTYANLSARRPNSTEALYRLAAAQAESGSKAAAVTTLQKLLAGAPEHVRALSLLGQLQLQAGRTDEVITLARTLQEREQTAPAGYLLEGDARRITDPDRAVEAYEAALRLEPSAEGILRLHEGLTSAGRMSEADARLREWVEARPGDWDPRMQWADLLLKRRDYTSAKPHYLAAVAQFPNNPKIHNNLAIVLANSGEDRLALEHAQRAASLRPDDAAILDTLGSIELQRGDLVKAMESLQRSVSLRPDYWESHFHLSRAYVKAKEYAKARAELERALQAHPPSDRMAELTHMLDELPL